MNSTSILESVKSQFDNAFETQMKSRIVTSLPLSNEVVYKEEEDAYHSQDEEVKVVLDTKKSKQPVPQKISQQVKLTSESVLPTSPSDGASWWIAPLEDGEIQRVMGGDILLGFYASEPTSFTFNYGYTHEKHNIAKDKFKHAYHSDVLSLIGYEVQKCSISNLSGSGYLVYATLDKQRRAAFRNA